MGNRNSHVKTIQAINALDRTTSVIVGIPKYNNTASAINAIICNAKSIM